MGHHQGTVEVLVRGVCVEDGRLLVCHSAGAAITYLPGGHLEFQERARECLARELMEECGLKARVGEFLGAVEHAFVQKGEPHAEINLVFAMDLPAARANQAVPACEAHLDFQWLDLATLAQSNLEPAVLRAILPRWAVGDRAVAWASSFTQGIGAGGGT